MQHKTGLISLTTNSISLSLYYTHFSLSLFFCTRTFISPDERMLRGHSIAELLRVNTGACRLAEKKHVFHIKKTCSGVNFTNILRAAFVLADPKSTKKLLNLTVFFALLVSAGVKAARRTLVKLTPGLGKITS